ncbi:MAG: type II toxin-antitoxin system PemK/MazF family toxin [Pseudomonadota bacterium]|nr:type II toxin-antitoxin system PemK/MazF family toxin [Pseudomonadota bacterium]
MIIKQGEVWLVKFFPKVGSEISKIRPAIVVSYNEIGRLPLKTIVPVTDWKTNYAYYPWMIQVADNNVNGLTKLSAIDCFQIKNFAGERFAEKSGKVSSDMIKQIHETIVKCLNPDYNLS